MQFLYLRVDIFACAHNLMILDYYIEFHFLFFITKWSNETYYLHNDEHLNLKNFYFSRKNILFIIIILFYFSI